MFYMLQILAFQAALLLLSYVSSAPIRNLHNAIREAKYKATEILYMNPQPPKSLHQPLQELIKFLDTGKATVWADFPGNLATYQKTLQNQVDALKANSLAVNPLVATPSTATPSTANPPAANPLAADLQQMLNQLNVMLTEIITYCYERECCGSIKKTYNCLENCWRNYPCLQWPIAIPLALFIGSWFSTHDFPVVNSDDLKSRGAKWLVGIDSLKQFIEGKYDATAATIKQKPNITMTVKPKSSPISASTIWVVLGLALVGGVVYWWFFCGQEETDEEGSQVIAGKEAGAKNPNEPKTTADVSDVTTTTQAPSPDTVIDTSATVQPKKAKKGKKTKRKKTKAPGSTVSQESFGSQNQMNDPNLPPPALEQMTSPVTSKPRKAKKKKSPKSRTGEQLVQPGSVYLSETNWDQISGQHHQQTQQASPGSSKLRKDKKNKSPRSTVEQLVQPVAIQNDPNWAINSQNVSQTQSQTQPASSGSPNSTGEQFASSGPVVYQNETNWAHTNGPPPQPLQEPQPAPPRSSKPRKVKKKSSKSAM